MTQLKTLSFTLLSLTCLSTAALAAPNGSKPLNTQINNLQATQPAPAAGQQQYDPRAAAPIDSPRHAMDKLAPAAGPAARRTVDAPAEPEPVSQAAPVVPVTGPASEFTALPGDVLQITVWKEDGLDRETIVLPDGTLTFPLIGTFSVKGLTPATIQEMIRQKLKPYIPDASVTVMVKAPLGHTASVVGQVAKPGELIIGRSMSVMEALSQVGGLTPYADTDDIIVIRYVDGKKQSLAFPYDSISSGRHLEKDITLEPGDVIVVPTAGLL